jgi:hypothetical protein
MEWEAQATVWTAGLQGRGSLEESCQGRWTLLERKMPIPVCVCVVLSSLLCEFFAHFFRPRCCNPTSGPG